MPVLRVGYNPADNEAGHFNDDLNVLLSALTVGDIGKWASGGSTEGTRPGITTSRPVSPACRVASTRNSSLFPITLTVQWSTQHSVTAMACGRARPAHR
jgi:hypothetical protein